MTITALKLAATFAVPGTDDVDAYTKRALAMLELRPSVDPSTLLSSPIGDWLIAAVCMLVSRAIGVPFIVVLKWPAVLADLGVAAVLLRVPTVGTVAALAYIVNPFTAVVSVYHGQLHTVAVLGATIATVLLTEGRTRASAVVLALAVTVRQAMAPLAAPFYLRAGRVRAAALVLFVVLAIALNAPLATRHAEKPKLYQTTQVPYGAWGYASILLQGPRVLALAGIAAPARWLAPINRFIERYGAGLPILWVAAFALWSWRHRDADLWRAAVLLFMGVYVTSPGMGMQYLTWVMPFLAAADRRRAVIFGGLAGGLAVGTYVVTTFPAKYKVPSFTANLGLLSGPDLALVLVVGAIGVATWLFCASMVWRVVKQPSAVMSGAVVRVSPR